MDNQNLIPYARKTYKVTTMLVQMKDKELDQIDGWSEHLVIANHALEAANLIIPLLVAGEYIESLVPFNTFTEE